MQAIVHRLNESYKIRTALRTLNRKALKLIPIDIEGDISIQFTNPINESKLAIGTGNGNANCD